MTIDKHDDTKHLLLKDNKSHLQFKLPDEFIDQFRWKQPEWGPLGYITYKRTYARDVPKKMYSDDDINGLEKGFNQIFDKSFNKNEWHDIFSVIIKNQNKLFFPLKTWKYFVKEIKQLEFIPKIKRDQWKDVRSLLNTFGKPERTEEYFETVRRVVEGVFSMQKDRSVTKNFHWDEEEGLKHAKKMYHKIWNFKMTPPGRGFWMMGTKFVKERGTSCLNNCAFVSTQDIDIKLSKPFCWTMDALMLGVGVGFDTRGKDILEIKQPNYIDKIYKISDDREGWVKSLKYVLDGFFDGSDIPIFNYSRIRPKGEPIKGFGGIASGPDPLENLLENIKKLLTEKIGKKLSSVNITDIFNNIGKCVVAGNVRRCLPKGTLIHTKKGLIPIEKIKKGMDVATSQGYSKVSEILEQGDQEIITINSQIGDFQCTPNHKIAIMNDIGQYIWKNAINIKKNDRLVFPIHEIEGQKTNFPAWNYDKTDHSINLNDIIIPKIDTDIAWFLGYFHKNGYVYPNFKKNGINAYISVSCPTNRPVIVKKCQDQMQRFGVKTYEPDIKGKYVSIKCISKQLAWYFDHFKKVNKNIVIPEYILKSTSNIRKAYLGGLLDADGSYLTKHLNLVSTIYKSFAYQVKSLYASIGIPTIIQIQKRKYLKHKTLYNINLVGSWCINRFENTVAKYIIKYKHNSKTKQSQNYYGFPLEWIITNGIKYKNKWSKTSKQMTYNKLIKCEGLHKQLIPIKVLSIDTTPIKVQTFDISVPECNEFIISNGLLVHNSAEICLGFPNDNEWSTMKQKDENILKPWEKARWASNNSLILPVGTSYNDIAKTIIEGKNGEPGIVWLENAQKFSRMISKPDNKDEDALGVNPCFVGNTLIAVADGRGAVTIKQLAEENKDVPVYSINKKGMIEIKMGRHPRITGYNKELVKITLDNGGEIIVTPDHKMILLNGMEIEAKNLKKGDSLPQLSKYTKDGKNYLLVKTNTIDMNKNHIAEHLLIEKFNHPKLLNDIHDKTNGLLKGNDFIIHHKDKNTLNNDKLKSTLFKFYKKFEQETDLETIWINNQLFIKRNCEVCNKEMILPIKSREQAYCSKSCINKNISHTTKRTKEQGIYFTNKQKNTLHKQIMIFKDLQEIIGKDPMKKEWENTCKEKKISYKFNPHSTNKYILKSFTDLKKRALIYNHRVIKVEKLKYTENVYNITIDTNHTIGIITHYDSSNGITDGIFASNCGEQTLESMEMCCLVETYPSRHENYKEFEETLKYAYMYGKTVTLGYIKDKRWTETNSIMSSNRRIGISQTGIIDAFARHSRNEILQWCDKGYNFLRDLDKKYSKKWMRVRESLKITSVKPSGTVSLLPGVSPGIHYPHSKYYIRRIRFSSDDPLVQLYKDANYHVYGDPDSSVYKYTKDNNIAKDDEGNDIVLYYTTYIIEFLIKEKYYNRGKDDITIWEQLENAAAYQFWWADNQVSITINYNDNEENDIATALSIFDSKLKSVSFMPNNHGYKNAPYEKITKKEYYNRISDLKNVDLTNVYLKAKGVKGCTNDSCEIKTEMNRYKESSTLNIENDIIQIDISKNL